MWIGFTQLADAVQGLDTIDWIGISNPAAGIEVALNTTRSPMDKLAVREAMMLTWDSSVGISDFTRLDGSDTESGSRYNMSVGLPLFQPDWQLPVSEFDIRFNDPEAANKKLATAGLSPTDNVVWVSTATP